MRLLSFVIFSSVCLCVLAQADSLRSEADPADAGVSEPENAESEGVVSRKRPLNFNFHVDYGKLLTLPFDFETKAEGGVILEIFGQIELVGEAGYWNKNASQAIKNGTYNATGTYWRVGAGVLLPFNKPGNQIGVGFRYAESAFADGGSFRIEDSKGLTAPVARTFSRRNLSAAWLSGVLTSMSDLRLRKRMPESPLNKMFKIGFQLRWRFLRSHADTLKDADPIAVYTIPGYGRTLSRSTMALNLFIRFYPLGYR